MKIKIGDFFSYGLWDGRQVPVKVKSLIDGYPAEFEVTETIPGRCKKGAILTWDDEDREEMKSYMEGNFKTVKEFYESR